MESRANTDDGGLNSKNANALSEPVIIRLRLPRRCLLFRAALSVLLLAVSQPGAISATFRWAASSSTVYVEGGGTATLSDIAAALPEGPVCRLIDPTNRVWFLNATIKVTDGSTLQLHGTSVGGDVNQLLLRSDNSTAAGSVIALDADWGTLDLRSVKITSWDQLAAAPDTEYATFKRAFIRARSRQVGSVIQQSTLNVADSEISHLGVNDREGYALTWQVVGAVSGVTVSGIVSSNYIHDCQLGVSTWAGDDVNWKGNEIAFNTLYGFDPDDPAQQAVLASNNVHDNNPSASFRYAATSGNIYVEGGGVATLSDVKAALPGAPLFLTDPVNRVWHLAANLVVVEGSTLRLHGSAVGGDVNELRLKSNNSSSPHSYVYVDADWGTLDLDRVKVTSWNETAGAPDSEYATFNRAFIRARSRQVGAVVQESTLNVINSDIGYLGSQHSESYALTWQVVGSAAEVGVFGTASGSYIHDCQLGVSTWAEDDVSWTGNEISFNRLYGFYATDPAHQAVLTANNVHDNDSGAMFRWASSSQRIYVTGPGSATLSEIKAALPNAPLFQVNPPQPGVVANPSNLVWYLGANLFVENGARLDLHGPVSGGDVAELRLKSDNTPEAGAVVELRADWGWLDIRDTRITSWDSAANGPDTETEAYRRAYIRARSKLDPDGVTAHESRMDVINSEICYLGSQNSEAYGLTWKVVDTTAVYIPPGSTKTLFDLVNVYGDIINSRIHHNHFGVYTYGHEGGQWLHNEVDHNLRYGFDPHDDSDNLVIENNNVHHNGWHGIIASKRCDNGVLRNNQSWNNGLDLVNPHGHGIMLHRSCDDWVIEGNQVMGNADTGIAIFACDRTVIRNNVCVSNANAGIRLSVGSSDSRVEGNEVGGAHRYGLYLFEGDDPPEPDDDGGSGSARCHGNTFANNFIQDCTSDFIKINGADGNAFLGNLFVGSSPTMRFENGTNNLVAGNVVPADVFVKLVGAATNFNSTTFKNQPRLQVQLDPFSTATFADDQGAIFDFDQGEVDTVVDDTGSFVTVSAGEVGPGANTVLTRNFFVVPNPGGVLVHPTVWNQSGDFSKEWIARASSGSVQIRYVVGDLQPGQTYRVRLGSALVAAVTADDQGFLSFTTTPGTTTALTYSVRP